MSNFFKQYSSIKPYLIRRDNIKPGDYPFMQSIRDRTNLVSKTNTYISFLQYFLE